MIRVNEYSIVDMYSNSYEVDFCLFGFFDKKFCFVVKWDFCFGIYFNVFIKFFIFIFYEMCMCILDIDKWNK